MRTKSKMAVAAALLSFSLIALSLMTAGVQAKALKLSFEYKSGAWDTVDPGRRWESDGILHIRGWVRTQTASVVDTDCDLTFVGDLDFVLNLNYFTETGERTGWGTWVKDGTFLKKDGNGDWQPYLTGVVEGTFTLFRRGEQVAARGRAAQGIGWGTEGGLLGWRIERFSYHEGEGLVFGGTLISPHG